MFIICQVRIAENWIQVINQSKWVKASRCVFLPQRDDEYEFTVSLLMGVIIPSLFALVQDVSINGYGIVTRHRVGLLRLYPMSRIVWMCKSVWYCHDCQRPSMDCSRIMMVRFRLIAWQVSFNPPNSCLSVTWSSCYLDKTPRHYYTIPIRSLNYQDNPDEIRSDITFNCRSLMCSLEKDSWAFPWAGYIDEKSKWARASGKRSLRGFSPQ